MKKIMLMTNPENADTIGSVPTSLYKLEKHVKNENGINTGNKVFITAVEQYLTKDNIEYWPLPYQTTLAEMVNERFDMVVAPLANIFGLHSECFLNDLSSWIERLTVPFYVLGCGIEATDTEELNVITRKQEKNVARFIEAIYKTGGEISTRGYYTKEFLDKCIYNTAIATGCPSLYRNGRLKFEKKEVDRSDFSVALVSADYPRKIIKKIFEDFPKSELFDQGIFISKYFSEGDEKRFWKRKLDIVKNSVYLSAMERGKMYPCIDIIPWQSELKKHSLAYGSRIHGINCAFEAGIPVILVTNTGLRTKEIGEYIGFPMTGDYCNEDIYAQYQKIDYKDLNIKYNRGLDIFNEFLRSNNITDSIEDNSLWEEKMSKTFFDNPKMW